MKIHTKIGLLHQYCLMLNVVVLSMIFSSQANATDSTTYYGQDGNVWGTDNYKQTDADFNGTITSTIAKETENNSFFGGYAQSRWFVAVHDNSVTFINGKANEVAAAGTNSRGSVYGNTLNITGGTIAGAYGGYTNTDSSVLNNTVIITGGTIGNVYGGYTEYGTISNDNSVIIKNSYSNASTNLYGTNILGGTNNSLEIRNKGINVASINNFNNIYFVIPNTVDNTPLLSVTTPVLLDNVSIGISTQPGTMLNLGDTITLINKTNGTNYQVVDMASVNLKDTSFVLDYSYDLSQEGTDKTLVATVSGKKANKETKALSEGQVAGMALLNAASDLIANAGLENARAATKGVSGKVAAFGALSGGYSKYKSGSHINMSNVSLLTGFSKKITDKALSGVFVEAGYGDYTTHNTFSKGKVKGNGDSKFYGLGLMGRYDMTKNFFADVSIHGGYLNNDWKSKDTKVPVDYGTDSLYYGAHFGLGYETPLTGSFEWGVYGKYFYTHQEGDKATIDDTKFDFRAINSHLTRLGSRLFYNISGKVKSYMGMAWDHEFNGKAKANAEEILVDAPTLKGDTGMLELGLKAENLKDSAWDVDAALQGFIGQREGIQGSIRAKYKF